MGYEVIKILMVDDHAIVREGYNALLEESPNLRIIAEADTGKQAYEQYKKYHPDVTILDLSLPDCSGLEALAKIKRFDPKAKVIIFTMYQTSDIASKSIKAGAAGYITKNSPPQSLIDAVNKVHSGKYALSSDIEKLLAIDRFYNEQSLIDKLSAREFEIFRLLVTAKSTIEIAQTLNISDKTVANYHYQIKSKLNVASDIELTLLAIQQNVIDPMGLKLQAS
nr:response regulator transcription factor [uncultured Methylophaga sp.]